MDHARTRVATKVAFCIKTFFTPGKAFPTNNPFDIFR